MVKLTREQLLDIYATHGIEPIIEAFLALQDTVEQLALRIKQLENRVNKDSHNSSKPPSSDWHRKAPVSLRRDTGKRPGGQPGHEGTSLKQRENPDIVVRHHLSGNCRCGEDLSKATVTGIEKRQVHDLPEKIELEVTEHQADIGFCKKCGAIHMAQFPAGVNAPVQYGHRVRGMTTYLSCYQLLPQKRTTEAMGTIFGVNLSEGTLNNILKTAYYRLKETEDVIKDQITSSSVAHADETGIYINGKRLWEHTLGTKLFTYYFVHHHRGKKALRDDATLKKFIGRLVHDGWMSYYDLDCLHALCNAHHLRELIGIRQEDRRQRWAETMIKLLCHCKKVVDRAKAAGRTQLAPSTVKRMRHRYEKILLLAERINPLPEKVPGTRKRGRIKKTPARNLIERLRNRVDETLAFIYDFNVPFDNNTSERDLRMTKVKQKISGCFRSLSGAQIFCRIRGYISTVNKHGLNIFDSLVKCFDPEFYQQNLIPIERE